MKTKDELLIIAKEAVDKSGGVAEVAHKLLMDEAEKDSEIMIGLMVYGTEIVKAMIEAQNETLQ